MTWADTLNKMNEVVFSRVHQEDYFSSLLILSVATSVATFRQLLTPTL
jgi:hypothetical protein